MGKTKSLSTKSIMSKIIYEKRLVGGGVLERGGGLTKKALFSFSDSFRSRDYVERVGRGWEKKGLNGKGKNLLGSDRNYSR